MISQLALALPEAPFSPLAAYDESAFLHEVLQRPDAALFISISGGKDSDALLRTLAGAHSALGWQCDVYAIHADLGRTEWPESLPHCQRVCDELGIPLIVVKRPQGDLLQEIQDRMAKLGGERNHWPTATERYCTADQKSQQLDKAKRAPFWPDAANRYCTADQKRGPINTAMRNATPHWPSADNRYCTAHHKTNQANTAIRQQGYSLVVSAMGIRGEESPARAKKPRVQVRAELSTKHYKTKVTVTDKKGRERQRELGLAPAEAWANWEPGKGRLAFDWNAIHHWSKDRVWQANGTTAADLERRQKVYRLGLKDEALKDWPCHPAYVYGNERVSCSLCVLASKNDLRVGAIHNPDLYREYVRMEQVSGFTFQHKKPLSLVAPELLGEISA